MNFLAFPSPGWPRLRSAMLAATLAALSLAGMAGPGAHGPNGEHLDGPPNTATGSALPRLEAKSEAFELLAELRASELTILIDRYETNEPVLGARLEVESGPLKAQAAFRAEQGDYVISDAALLKKLATAGEHALVFTLVAGQDSDLLDGTLVVAGPPAASAAADGHGQDHAHAISHRLERAAWIGAGIAVLTLLGGVSWWRQRRRQGHMAQGGL